ncbi:MAG TPA: serpin family protein [Anaerolineaceae bacterium]|nr:serpin family protein [Anaerolineaceae bacterium]
MKKVTLFVLLVMLVSACTPQGGNGNSSPEISSSIPRDMEPAVPSGNLEKLVKGNTSFGINLFQAVKQGDENLIFSPYSISVALAMAQAGAKDNTLQQMNAVLRFSLPVEDLHPAFNALQLELNNRENNDYEEGKKDFELNIVNSIWGEKTYTFLPGYLDLLAKNYGTGLRLADFIQQADTSRKEINQWVSDQTNDRIQDLLPENSITELTRLVLTNAIYFKAGWLHQFDPGMTQNGVFTLLNGEDVQVPMMHQTETFGYAREDGYQLISLPYEGNKLSMLIILPDENNFTQVEKAMSGLDVQNLVSSISFAQLDLSMPKFKIESSIGLADHLNAMGMKDAFIPGIADFSGMDGTHDLYISAVQHKAFIEVDETGTEAAAATAVVVGIESMPIDEPLKVNIDRPFIFIIVDNKTGSVLFLGRVINPAS